jgi:protein-S-isoprenylcysteine O-methyltransferase Ste14
MALGPHRRRQADCSRASDSFFGKGGGWVVAQFLVMTSWVALTPKGRKLTDSTLGRVTAAALMSAGAAAALSGSIMLGKSLSPFPKPPAHARLTRLGAYALVRHPLYAGLIALSLGWACLWGSARGAALALVQAVFLDAKARREERWLREKFPDYGQYAAKVRRLIPWIY